MKITSSYHKKLHCQIGDKSIGIEPRQITTVEDEIGKVLIENPWIHVAKEGAGIPTFRPPCISCETEKPIEKEARKPIEKKEGSVEKIERPIGKEEKLVKKKGETLKRNPIKKRSNIK